MPSKRTWMKTGNTKALTLGPSLTDPMKFYVFHASLSTDTTSSSTQVDDSMRYLKHH